MKDTEAALAAASALFAGGGEEAEETAEETEIVAEGAEEAVAEEATEEEEDLAIPSFDIELPEDLSTELEEPVVNEDDILQEIEEDEEFELMDEREKQLLARARAAERKAEHLEKLRLQEAKGKWKEEAQKFFPLAAHVLDTIDATSRRGFLRAAKEAHEAVLPYVKQVQETAQKVVEKEKEKAREQARKEAADAWGIPATDGAPSEARVIQQDVAQVSRKKDLAGTLREMMFPKGS